MKSIKAILTPGLLSLFFIPSFAQSTKKVCLPLEVIFKNFQKQSMNLSLGASSARSRFNDKNYFDFSGWLGLNYFPRNFLEVGIKVKPTLATSINMGKTPVLENNLYLRYYPVRLTCYKLTALTGVGISRDGSTYSLKGEPINKNKLFPSLSLGFVMVPAPMFQFEVYSEFFANRTTRYNIAVNCNLKNFKRVENKE